MLPALQVALTIRIGRHPRSAGVHLHL